MLTGSDGEGDKSKPGGDRLVATGPTAECVDPITDEAWGAVGDPTRGVSWGTVGKDDGSGDKLTERVRLAGVTLTNGEVGDC